MLLSFLLRRLRSMLADYMSISLMVSWWIVSRGGRRAASEQDEPEEQAAEAVPPPPAPDWGARPRPPVLQLEVVMPGAAAHQADEVHVSHRMRRLQMTFLL